MICSACNTYARFEDGFCSACGVERPTSRLPVKRAAGLPALPAVWRQTAPVLARGAALIAAGIAAEFLLRSMARGVVSQPSRPRKTKALAKPETTVVQEFVAVSRTVVTRRVVTRR